MSWIVTLKIVDCGASSTLLSGAKIYSPLLNTLGNAVFTDANGQAQIYDAYDQWEWVNLTISKAGTGGSPSDPGYDPGYIDKNFVISMSQDGTVQTVCLNKAPPRDPTGTGTTVSCFIVTATTGSPDSAEVVRLRALRDRVSEASGLGAGLIEAVYSEYERFSPAIAAELTRDDVARGTVLNTVVRPLLAWYSLAGELGFGHGKRDVDAAAREVVESCPEQYGAVMVGLLESAGAGAWIPESTPSLLSDLAPRVAEFPFASWAILDPLTRVWSARVEQLDVVEQVGQWLAAAPLELLDPPTGKALERELETLAAFLSFDPEQRRRLGKRLSAAWPVASSSVENARWLEPASQRS